MRKTLLLLVLTILLIYGCKNNNIQISGTIINPKTGEYLYLSELMSTMLKPIDSVKVGDDGTFILKTQAESPAYFVLRFSENNFLTMTLSPGEKVTLIAHHDSLNYPVSVSGSEGTELIAEYNQTLRNTIKKLSGLSEIYRQNSESTDLPAVIESLDSMAQNYLNDLNTYTKNFIDENLTSLVSLIALYQQVAPGVYVMNPARDVKYYIKVDSALSILYPDYEPVKTLREQVNYLVSNSKEESTISPSTIAGAEAPEISLPGPEGDTIKLSSTRGSVVLLDFWASWCGPCRRENPNLVKAYNLYNRKGFQIYQVSLDKTKEDWIKGINDDKLSKWIHVSDIKYWNSAVIPVYKIESIPTNFLLDREGRIIASNLRGEQLQIKLAELFD